MSHAAFLDELRKIAACKARMTVPQTRRDRRPMSVDTMLKKEKDGTLFKEGGVDPITAKAFFDELTKISEGSPVGRLINADLEEGAGDEQEVPTAGYNPSGRAPDDEPTGVVR